MMSSLLSENLVSKLSDFVASRMGLHFPSHRHADLLKGARSAARELGCEDLGLFVDKLLSTSWDREQIELLARHLTVGETYFFRNKGDFNYIENIILPRLVRSRKSGERYLRFWSAACCSGEEAYSVAMMLDNCLPSIQDWNVTILGTDINPHFLRKAQEGVYREWSFRQMPRLFRTKYFEEMSKGCFRIIPRIRKMVQFSYLNLVSDPYPSISNGTNAMDVILCRNVLIYFLPRQMEEVIRGLSRSIVDDGWLAVSACEAPYIPRNELCKCDSRDAMLFRKADAVVPERRPSSRPPATQQKKRDKVSPADAGKRSMVRPAWQSATPEPPDEKAEEADPCTEAELLFDKGQYAKAADRLIRILSGNANDTLDRAKSKDAMILLVRALANAGRLRDALEWCETSVDSDKLDPRFHFLHATILQETAAAGKAAEALRRVLYLDPGHVLAHFSLGNLCRVEGRTEESKRHFENALKQLNDLPKDRVIPESDGITAGRLASTIEVMNR